MRSSLPWEKRESVKDSTKHHDDTPLLHTDNRCIHDYAEKAPGYEGIFCRPLGRSAGRSLPYLGGTGSRRDGKLQAWSGFLVR